MIDLRAIVKLLGGWRAAIFAVLAVAALSCFLVMRGNAAADRLRADAAEQRAQTLAGELQAAKQANQRDVVASKATDVARKAADARQPEREARAARVRDYADSAAGACIADPRIVSELREGEDRIRTAAGRLRGDR